MRGLTEKSKVRLFGVLALGAGVTILLLVNFDPSSAQAPLWVVNAAAMTFVLAGLSIFANSVGLPLISRLSGAAIAWMLAVPGFWMLFDGQGASCSASVTVGSLSAASGAASGLCRAVFGIGGLITLVVAIAFTWLAFRPLHQGQAKGTGEAPSKV
jgi:hypothetical protein